MTPQFRNFGLENRIFAQAQKSKNLIAVAESEGVAIFFSGLAGGLSLALVSIHMIRRVVAPKSNTGAGDFAPRLHHGRSIKNRCSRSICSLSEDLK